MEKKLILLIFIALIGCLSHAQENYKDGYVITNNNDTIYGQIDYRGDLMMGKTCHFIPQGSSLAIEYSPEQIISYRFNDGKYFISKDIPTLRGKQKVFLEYLVNGELNVYYLRQSTDHYYIEKDDQNLIELPYEEEIRYKNNARYLYQSKKHIGLLQYYMQDAPKLRETIAQIKKPDQNNLVKIAENYHNIVCTDHKCITYQKNITLFKISIEAVWGITNPNYYDFSRDINAYYQGGIVAHLNLLRANEKLYFRTGFILSSYKLDKGSKQAFKVPLHLEYIYPKGTIRPRASYGVNIFSPYDILASAMLGFNLKLEENLHISFMSEFEYFSEALFLPKDYQSSSYMVGVFYNFK